MFSLRSLGRVIAIAVVAVQCCPGQEDQADWVLKDMLLRSKPETRVALLDQYRTELQKAELIPWAFNQICEGFEAAGQVERALAAGEHLLELDPQAIEIAERGLQAAEKKQDETLIRKWSDLRARAASGVLAAPRAGDGRKEIARSVQLNSEYHEFLAIRSLGDAAVKRDRIEEFLRSHPNSPYRSAADDLSLASWNDSAEPKKKLAAAKKILERDPSQVAALTILAENYLESEADPAKLVTYATRILALLNEAPKPEGVADAEWSQKKSALAGRAHWMIGSGSIQQEKYREADTSIRAALPYLKGNNRMTSAALFYLGWANYRMGRLSDAIRFNRECAQVQGPFREHAEKNLLVIRAEAAAASN